LTAHEFTTYLQGVRPTDDGFTGRCPAHDDQRASLSFQGGERGGLHCYRLLREPFDLPGEAQKAKSYLRRLALHLGGDLNSAVERMLGVAERVWHFNGRFDFLQRLYVTEARWQCQF
jgi:hypothetical protein